MSAALNKPNDISSIVEVLVCMRSRTYRLSQGLMVMEMAKGRQNIPTGLPAFIDITTTTTKDSYFTRQQSPSPLSCFEASWGHFLSHKILLLLSNWLSSNSIGYLNSKHHGLTRSENQHKNAKAAIQGNVRFLWSLEVKKCKGGYTVSVMSPKISTFTPQMQVRIIILIMSPYSTYAVYPLWNLDGSTAGGRGRIRTQ